MPHKKTDVIIIRGAPCSGKSTTAKSLSEFFPKGARVEIDTLRNMVISVDWKNQTEHINMLQVSTGLVHGFLKLGFNPVIVVDTFSGGKIMKYLENLYQLKKDLPIKIFGLYTTEDEMRKRTESRSDGEFKDLRICNRLNEEVQRNKQIGEYQIDTTGLLPVETAKMIYEMLYPVNG